VARGAERDLIDGYPQAIDTLHFSESGMGVEMEANALSDGEPAGPRLVHLRHRLYRRQVRNLEYLIREAAPVPRFT
jgi:hypothetical protein